MAKINWISVLVTEKTKFHEKKKQKFSPKYNEREGRVWRRTCIVYDTKSNAMSKIHKKSRITNVKQTKHEIRAAHSKWGEWSPFLDRRREQVLAASFFYSLQKQTCFHYTRTCSRTDDTCQTTTAEAFQWKKKCEKVSLENNWRSSGTRGTKCRTANRSGHKTTTIKARTNLADEQQFECNTNYVFRVFHQFHLFICVFFILSNLGTGGAGVRP